MMFRSSSLLFHALSSLTCSIALLQGSTYACPNTFWIADGYCDPDCNNKDNDWDGGDCCESTCVDATYDCGINGYDCKQEDTSVYQFKKQYSGFELTLKCDKDAQAGYAVGYSYSLTKDIVDRKTKRTYRNDRSIPDECQQQFKGSSLPSYKTDECSGKRQSNPFCYDRGHVVMANHMDGTSQTRQDASYVTNILPQVAGFNQPGGAWYETEKIIECQRDSSDVDRLEIFGGMIYDDESNDFFLESNGIPTPDTYWKVVVKYFKKSSVDPDVIAWLMKNDVNDKASNLDKRFNEGGDLIQIKTLKRIVDDSLSTLPMQYTEKAFDIGSSWDGNDGNCNRPNPRADREL